MPSGSSFEVLKFLFSIRQISLKPYEAKSRFNFYCAERTNRANLEPFFYFFFKEIKSLNLQKLIILTFGL